MGILVLEPTSVGQLGTPTGGEEWAGDYADYVMQYDGSPAGVYSQNDGDFTRDLAYTLETPSELEFPDSRVIVGFQLRVSCGVAAEYADFAAPDRVRLIKVGGGQKGDIQAYEAGHYIEMTYAPDLDNYLFGDGTSKWGWADPTPADFRAGMAFAFNFQFFGTSAWAGLVMLDHARLAIYYEVEAAPTGRRRIIVTG